MTFDAGHPIALKMAASLASINYRNPGSDPSLPRPAKFTFGADFFEHIHEDPSLLTAFNSSMKTQDPAPASSIPVFPFQERAAHLPASAVALVDVGGGHGGCLESLHKAQPDIKRRIILQDLAPVIAESDTSVAPFELMAHDFFTPQPVRGALFYHFRCVLHDWSDEACKRISENVAKGFTEDHSRLLLQEFVLPNMGCDKWDALRDLNMMNLEGMERSRSQWEESLGGGGFRIKGIDRAESGSLAIIRAEPVDDVAML